MSKSKSRKITLDLVLSATSLTRSSTESSESYLQRVTHLHLQGKRIKTIEGLDQCTNLKVLYLYDNLIEHIQNLDFATILQYLHLQNNAITEVPSLPMPSLRKLYLDENEISQVTGLDACVILEELHVANQRLPSFSSLQFDVLSLEAISGSLEVLEISGNGISVLEPFCVLYNLRKLFCNNNDVKDMEEVEKIIGLSQLAEASFIGNPCTSIEHYRNFAIGASSDALRTLDNVHILRHQQVAIRGLMAHRRKLGSRRNTNNLGGKSSKHHDNQIEFGINF